MADTLITTSLAVRTALEAFKYATPFIQTIKSYSDKFPNVSNNSRKTSTTISVPKPARYIPDGGRGITNATYVAKPTVEEIASLTVDSYRKIGITFGTQEMTTDLTDFAEQCKSNAVIDLANFVERDHLLDINNVSNVVLAGSSGLVYNDATEALSILDEMGAPMGNRNLLAPQRLHSALVNDTSNLFNDQKTISKQYLEGYMGKAAGFDWMKSELIPTHTNGSATDGVFDTATGLTPLGAMNGATANGATTLVIDSIGTDGTITAGSIVGVADVNAVNNVTRDSLGRLRFFNVASTETSVAGAVTLTVTEAIVDGSGASSIDASLQNVTALPANAAVVFYVGEVSTLYRQAIAYSKETFGCAFLNLTMPWAGASGAMAHSEGQIMRMIKDYEHEDDTNIFRLDCKFGVFTPRPEWGVRIWQKA